LVMPPASIRSVGIHLMDAFMRPALSLMITMSMDVRRSSRDGADGDFRSSNSDLQSAMRMHGGGATHMDWAQHGPSRVSAWVAPPLASAQAASEWHTIAMSCKGIGLYTTLKSACCLARRMALLTARASPMVGTGNDC
jgi:hypothetical protein